MSLHRDRRRGSGSGRRVRKLCQIEVQPNGKAPLPTHVGAGCQRKVTQIQLRPPADPRGGRPASLPPVIGSLRMGLRATPRPRASPAEATPGAGSGGATVVGGQAWCLRPLHPSDAARRKMAGKNIAGEKPRGAKGCRGFAAATTPTPFRWVRRVGRGRSFARRRNSWIPAWPGNTAAGV